MDKLKVNKALSSLPTTLEANTIYVVRVGLGFELFVSDIMGETAHSLNIREEDAFDKVARNLKSFNQKFNYTDGYITSITYTKNSHSFTQTFNYTDGYITSKVLSGPTLVGISLTKTFEYVDGRIDTGIYS